MSHFAADQHFFSAAVNNPPLHALGVSNGGYAYGGGGIFPTGVFNETNYGVDIVFVPGNFKIVFQTANRYTGNLGGIVGANAICQTEAENAGLPGTYKAWLSVVAQPNQLSPSNDSTHLTNIAYRDVDGTLVANSWTDLITNGIHNNFETPSGGRQIEGFAWGDTGSTGSISIASTSNTCGNWTSTNGNGELLDINPGTFSADDGANPCDSIVALLCFQQ